MVTGDESLTCVIPTANKVRIGSKRIYRAIGKGLKIKVNANIGTSPSNVDPEFEFQKASIASTFGADAIMDLSIAGDLDAIRQNLVSRTDLLIGTVPLYDTISRYKGNSQEITGDMMLESIERHARQGIDFMTIHSGITLAQIPHAEKRLMGIVSRGGSFLARWMKVHKKENPLYERFDEVCDILRENDVTLSLGDSLRPGALADAGDTAQMNEISILGTLVRRARDKGVQVMVEGPGHVPLHLIEEQIHTMDRLCFGAPLYILGPLVTDRAPGYDHITSAIGGAIAARAGASFLCYVTPAEHLRLPDLDDVKEGVIASKIAAHAADIANGIKGAAEEDRTFSEHRKNFDWEEMYKGAIDPIKPRQYRVHSTHDGEQVCSMCGEFCAMKKDTGDK